jgi:hypothetical protein
MSATTTAHLDKDALVARIATIRCNGSTKGALNMLRLGCRIKELIGGLDCWRVDGYRGSRIGSCAGCSVLRLFVG